MPSFIPRSDRMTEMKWMQEERRRGRAVDLVRSWWNMNVSYVLVGVSMSCGTYPHVDVRNVADDVALAVEYWK